MSSSLLKRLLTLTIPRLDKTIAGARTSESLRTKSGIFDTKGADVTVCELDDFGVIVMFAGEVEVMVRAFTLPEYVEMVMFVGYCDSMRNVEL